VELKRFIEFSEPDSARAVRGAKLEVSRKHRRKKTTIMPLLHILLALIIVGSFLWLVNRFILWPEALNPYSTALSRSAYSESSILFREFEWGDELTGQISHVTFRREHGLALDAPFITGAEVDATEATP
jgi:hypothetical protein